MSAGRESLFQTGFSSWRSDAEGNVYITITDPVRQEIRLTRRDIERMESAGDLRMRRALRAMREAGTG